MGHVVTARGRTRRILGSCLLALAGCAVGPDYVAPAPDRHAAPLASVDDPSAGAAGIASGVPIVGEWWLTLEDEKLTRLVGQLVEDNLDLAAAMARVREARAARGVAAASLYPQLRFGGSSGIGGQGDRFQGSLVYSVGFDASWELDLFGGVRRGIEAAEADAQASVEARRATLVSLLGELGRTYVELRGEQRQLAIARRNVALQARTLELVRVRRRTGLASDLQVSQAATLLETTRADIPRAEAAVSRSSYRLGVLVGREPRALLAELSEPGPLPAVPPAIPVGLPSDLLAQRPDLRRAERALAAATARAGVARADLYPRFSLTGNVSYSSTHGIDGHPSFYAGPAVSWPVLDGGRIRSGIDAQDARLEQAILAYRGAILLALEEVENAITAYSKELVRRDGLGRAAREAETAAAAAQTQYRNGLVDFLNVLSAQGTLAASQQALVLSEQALLTDLIAVYKALGGGWNVHESGIETRERREPRTELPR